MNIGDFVKQMYVLIPFLAQYPNWVKIIIAVWILFTAALFILLILVRNPVTSQDKSKPHISISNDKAEQNRILLLALKTEIESNLGIYQSLKADKKQYLSGQNIHFVNYEIDAYKNTKSSNAFQFNTALQTRINDLYSMLRMSNNLFAELRKAGTSKAQRINHFEQIFSDYEKNENAWHQIVLELAEYINNYRAINEQLSQQSEAQGAYFAMFLEPNSDRLSIINVSKKRIKKKYPKNRIQPPIFTSLNLRVLRTF